jgi:large subunit ribosomal protein L3
MTPALLGKKVGMTRIYDPKGKIVPVTVVQAEPNVITQVKTADGKDGYNAVQLGFGECKPKFSTFPMIARRQGRPRPAPPLRGDPLEGCDG